MNGITPASLKRIFFWALIAVFIGSPGLSASSQDEGAIPDYSARPRSEVPAEFTWNTRDLFPSLDAWKAEMDSFSRDMEAIDAAKAGWTSSAGKMLEFITLIEKLRLRAERLSVFIHLFAATDDDPRYSTLGGELHAHNVRFKQKLSFYDGDILALGGERFAAYVREEPRLADYRMRVEGILRLNQHVLPEEQQRILTLSALFSGIPAKAANKLNEEMPPAEITLKDGSTVALDAVNFGRLRRSADPEERRQAMAGYWQNKKRFENTIAILFDGAIQRHFFSARVGGYSECLEAQLFPNAIDRDIYLQLISSVRENLPVLHRFLRIKQRLLGLDVFCYEDIHAPVVGSITKKFSFSETEKLVKESMKPLGKAYASALDKAFADRWLDIYLNKGKASNAYTISIYGIHPFIYLDYTGNFGSVATVAHELGHGLHSFFSDRKQPQAMAQYPVFLAEIASTFNENLLMEHLIKTGKDDRWNLVLLDRHLVMILSSIFHDTMLAEFELAMHRHVESGQSLTAAWLNRTYLDLARAYYGHGQGVCKVEDYVGSEWIGVPHLLFNYYVYQYSTGRIASLALSDMVLREGATGARRYLDFLSAGGSDYPLEILKKAGMDMRRPDAFRAAFRRIDVLLNEMENLVAHMNQSTRKVKLDSTMQ